MKKAMIAGVALLVAGLGVSAQEPSAPANRSGNAAAEFGEALRYALGGEEKIGPDATLWVAAVRARGPFAGGCAETR